MNPDPSLPDSVERLAASVVALVTRRHRSSGVLWRNGVAVGSAAALWRASSVSLVLPNGEEVSGDVCGVDAGTDLAAITFDSGAMPVAERLADPAPRVGDFVFAVGREPSGSTQASFGHIGLVGGAWRSWRGGRLDRLIRLDGGLYPGLEGAAVADASGQVLGIASPMFSRQHGVVVPATTIDPVLDQLLAHGRVARGYIGIAAQPARSTHDGQPIEGLLITSVAEDSPAAKGGLMVGDLVINVAGESVASLDALRAALRPGAQVRVQLIRGGQRHELSLEVGERPRSRCG